MRNISGTKRKPQKVSEWDVRSGTGASGMMLFPRRGRAGRRRRRRVKTSSDVAAVMKRAGNDWRQEVERKGRERGSEAWRTVHYSSVLTHQNV